MCTRNICFHGEIRKNINTFGWKKKPLSEAMGRLAFVIASALASTMLKVYIIFI